MAPTDPDRSLDTFYRAILLRVFWTLAAVFLGLLVFRGAQLLAGAGLQTATGKVILLRSHLAADLPAILWYAGCAVLFRRLPCRPWTVDGLGLALIGIGCVTTPINLVVSASPLRYHYFAILILFAGLVFRRTRAYLLALGLILLSLLVACGLVWPEPVAYHAGMIGFATVLSLSAHYLFLRLNQRSVLLMRRFRTAVSQVRTLRGLLPVCSLCRRIRDESGRWDRLETYMGAHTEASLALGLCPECARGNDQALKTLGASNPMDHP